MQQSVREFELEAALQSCIDSNATLSLFALIDGTGNNNALYQFFRYAPEADYHPLFLGTDQEPCLPHSPYLVKLGSEAKAFVEQASSVNTSVIWFTSPLELSAQIEFWTHRLYATMPDGRCLLFRLWNGHILHTYLATLTHAEQASLLWPVCHVVTPNPSSQQWQVHSIQPASALTPTPASLDWHLTTEQLNQFEPSFQAVQRQDIESALWERRAEYMDRIHPSQVQPLIESAITQAHQLALASDAAVERFVECCVVWGLTFWKHSDFSAVWQSADPGQAFLAHTEPYLTNM